MMALGRCSNDIIGSGPFDLGNYRNRVELATLICVGFACKTIPTGNPGGSTRWASRMVRISKIRSISIAIHPA